MKKVGRFKNYGGISLLYGEDEWKNFDRAYKEKTDEIISEEQCGFRTE